MKRNFFHVYNVKARQLQPIWNNNTRWHFSTNPENVLKIHNRETIAQPFLGHCTHPQKMPILTAIAPSKEKSLNLSKIGECGSVEKSPCKIWDEGAASSMQVECN